MNTTIPVAEFFAAARQMARRSMVTELRAIAVARAQERALQEHLATERVRQVAAMQVNDMLARRGVVLPGTMTTPISAQLAAAQSVEGGSWR